MGNTPKATEAEDIIRMAVEAGRIAGKKQVDDVFKATERRLYSLPRLQVKIEDDKEKLEQLKTHGTPERSRSIVRFSRSGYRVSPEDLLEALIKDLESTIATDEIEVETLQNVLSHLDGDPFLYTVTGKYIDGYDDEDIADDLRCGATQVWKQRTRIVRDIAVMLYGATATGA